MDESKQSRADESHIYVRHDGDAFFLAEDGSFVPELGNARVFISWDDAFSALDALIGDRDLGNDEPGVVANAWK